MGRMWNPHTEIPNLIAIYKIISEDITRTVSYSFSTFRVRTYAEGEDSRRSWYY